jgi:hypothetical protein
MSKRVLVACEFSGIVRDAFIQEGFEAVSCDIRESENGKPHIQDDVMNVIDDDWDMMIAIHHVHILLTVVLDGFMKKKIDGKI